LSEKTKGAHFLLKTTDVNESARVFALALDKISEELHQLVEHSEGATYIYRPEFQVWERVSNEGKK
jgi:hypothetical protein